MINDRVQRVIKVQKSPTRSPFSVKVYEILAAAGVGIASWFGIRAYLWNIPYPAPLYSYGGKLPPENVQARQSMFDVNGSFLAVLIGISFIFLLRGILEQNIRYFTRKSNLAVAFPMLLFVFSNISLATDTYFSGLYCLIGFILLPVGIVIAILGLADATRSQTRKEERRLGWLYALGWNLLFFAAASGYYFDWFKVFGD